MTNSYKKNYVCIFPGFRNFHLVKDVGLLPYTMGKYFNYNAAISSLIIMITMSTFKRRETG